MQLINKIDQIQSVSVNPNLDVKANQEDIFDFDLRSVQLSSGHASEGTIGTTNRRSFTCTVTCYQCTRTCGAGCHKK